MRVDEIAAQRSQARENAILVGAGEARIADNVSDQDRRKLALLAPLRRHREPSGRSPIFSLSQFA